MRKTAMQQYQIGELYLRRPRLTTDSLLLVRLRVAMQAARQLFLKVQHRYDERTFPHYLVIRLDRMAAAGQPHPLDEELRDVVASWRRGETHADLYARALELRAKRIIRRVRYGGRRAK